MLTAENISVSFRNRQILNDVSVRVVPGQFTAVVGPNGAGKSTLLKLLSGEMRPSSGRININGNGLNQFNPKSLSLVRAVLPQHTQVQFAFSVEQIVLLGRQAHASTAGENAAIIQEVMELTGVAGLRSRVYHTLSGGERQRVQLARVLVQVWEQTVFPRYLLLDEPTSSLDIAQQDIIFSLARVACSRNIGVLAIIHDLNHAVQFSDEMLFLRGGRCVAAGTSAEVFSKSAIEETFGCRVNLFHLDGRTHPLMIPDYERDLSGFTLRANNKSSNQ